MPVHEEIQRRRENLSGVAVPLSAVYKTAFRVGRHSEVQSFKNDLITMYGEDMQRIKMNQVYLELRDF
jgi:hypothetical protein